MTPDPRDAPAATWEAKIPDNVRLGADSRISGHYLPGDGPFKLFRSKLDPAVVIGRGCRIDDSYFNLGEQARVEIGDHCALQGAFLIGESDIRIGNYVYIGWHAIIVDADFHPIDPLERIADTEALSPRGVERKRHRFACEPVVVGDDVWIGPNAMLLKGVHVGAGAWIDPGAVVVADVPAGAHMSGNPAQPLEPQPS